VQNKREMPKDFSLQPKGKRTFKSRVYQWQVNIQLYFQIERNTIFNDTVKY
jgi:hypothetical protein